MSPQCPAHLICRLALLCVATALVGCASSGSPLLRTRADDGHGQLVPGCQNVSPATPPLTYETRFYLSTWGSAWSEGARTGLQTGFQAAPEDRSHARFTKELARSALMRVFGFDGSNYPSQPYCMLYRAGPNTVATALRTVLPQLGNTVVRDQEALGIFGTEFLQREHRAARWRDRYIITTREMVGGGTSVFVFRDLLISRQNSPYTRAESNGGNEAWILLKIASQLR